MFDGLKKQNLMRIVWLATSTITIAHQQAASASEVDTIAGLARQNVSAINSFQCEYQYRDSDGFEFIGNVYFKEDKIRLERKHTRVPEVHIVVGQTTYPKKEHSIHLFDGTRHCLFEVNSGFMRLVDENTEPIPLPSYSEPLATAYSWVVLPNENRYWQRVRDSAEWSARFAGAVVVEQSVRYHDFDCVVIKVRTRSSPPNADFNKRYTLLHLAKDDGYVAVRRESFRDGTSEGETSIEELLSVDVGGDHVFIPTKIKYVGYPTPNGALGHRWREVTVDPESIAINAPIDDALFSLSPRLAKTIYDVDETVRAGRDQRLDWHDRLAARHRRRLLWGSATVIVFGVIVLALYTIRLRRKSG